MTCEIDAGADADTQRQTHGEWNRRYPEEKEGLQKLPEGKVVGERGDMHSERDCVGGWEGWGEEEGGAGRQHLGDARSIARGRRGSGGEGRTGIEVRLRGRRGRVARDMEGAGTQ
eukprot:3931832-Rhodomonas_salina.2